MGKANRFRLEIVTEREIAHHLEERKVSSCRPDDVDVNRADTFLHRYRTFPGRYLLSQEIRLERDHTGVVQQQRRIRWDQRGRGTNDVFLASKIIKKRATKLIGIHKKRKVSRFVRESRRSQNGRQLKASVPPAVSHSQLCDTSWYSVRHIGICSP